MAILRDAAPDEVQHILELFPRSTLKRTWPHLQGTKEELCNRIARREDRDQIASFIATNFARCKQHVYVMKALHDEAGGPDEVLPDADALRTTRDTTVYLGESRYTVLLAEPFAREEIRLLWPIRVQRKRQITLVSFIVLERDVRALFDRAAINVRRHIEEADIADNIYALGYERHDLNKGIKELWAEEFMDAFRVKFKKPHSTTTEVMDRARGIKATNTRLYTLLQGLPLYESSFRVGSDAESAVEVFQANPTDGVIKMVRYTEGEGDSDELIESILSKNR